MARRKKKKSKEIDIDLTSIILILVGVVLSIIIYSGDLGTAGNFIKFGIFSGLFGKVALAIPIALILLGVYVLIRDYSRLKLKSFQVMILAASVAGIITLLEIDKIIPDGTKGAFAYLSAFYKAGASTKMIGGGVVGGLFAVPLCLWFNPMVAYAIMGGLVILSAMCTTGITISAIIFAIQELWSEIFMATKNDLIEKQNIVREKRLAHNSEKFKQIARQTEIVSGAEQLNFDLGEEELTEEEIEEKDYAKENLRKLVGKTKRANKEIEEEEIEEEELELEHNAIEEYEEYEFPPINLLYASKRASKDYSVKELRETAIKLQTALESYGVDAKVTNVIRGPTVTRYELQPSIGVKVSKILRLADDLSLNLAAKSIRIEAPIPGKSVVGVEVPNKSTDTVSLREIIESDEFADAKSKVTFSLGKSIDGNSCVADIAKMPHMLIAGATGSGKSVCINSIIMSILYKAQPSEVKLILIDPKVVELSVYNGIPHLLIPVVTDPKKAAGALNWAVQEMENRYQLFASKGVRDIRGYNELLSSEGEEGVLPQIVVIIDELADLMMVSSNEVEDAICRIAQKARAAGMHLIVATQRPSVDVVTGIIKANIPSRIAFTVSSQVDSRTILDMAGAEKLLGRGDMLYFPVGEAKPMRIQGSFVSDGEVESAVEYIKKHNAVHYNESVIETLEKVGAPQVSSEVEDDCDEFLMEAIELAISMGQISASMIQRKFKVGYARAGRIVDQMEERGIISEFQGSKPRKVKISKEEWEEMQEQGEVSFEEDDEEYETEEE